MHRLWLIAYDIVEDKTRLRVERALLALGDRVQWSVFEVVLAPHEQTQLQATLLALIDSSADSVRFYPLCHWCQERVSWQGLGRRHADQPIIVV